MNVEENIIAEAQKLFDTAGITSGGKDSILILGLATAAERDLDDFSRDENDVFRIRGFDRHVQPRLDSLVSSIHEQGLSPEILGHCGYPNGEMLNLKQQAVAAGLGSWGKNSMVLHPRFGLWLRLMTVRIVGTVLSSTGSGRKGHTENPLCKDCTACIDACPLGILEPYYLRDIGGCLANIPNIDKSQQPGEIECCDLCWKACPVGQ